MNIIKNIKTNQINSIASYSGVILKTLLLLLITGIMASTVYLSVTMTTALAILISSSILCLILVFLAPNKIHYKDIALPFSCFEGMALGALTYIIETKHPGVGVKAILATIASFCFVYFLYAFKLVKVTEKLRKYTYIGLILGSVLLLSILILVLLKVLVITPIIGIILFGSIFVLGLFTLLTDFEDVFQAVNNKVDKKEEWTLAISLLLSIVLIYESLLRVFGFTSGD